jgi:hypothetical protein
MDRRDMGRTRNEAPPPMPAMAPRAMTGAAAFDQAKQSGELSQAASLAEADAVAEREVTARRGGAVEVKRAGGHIFTLTDGIWTDIAHRDTLRTVTVAPFGPAYFALVRALPELAACLDVGDELLVAGRAVSIRVSASGAATLTEREVRTIAHDFRRAA